MGRNLIVRGAALAVGLAVAGCAFQTAGAWVGYRFFAPPGADDPWSGKIRGWQARERAMGSTDVLAGAPASVSQRGARGGGTPEESDLRAKYFAFRREQKREIATRTAAWVQREARSHYRPDGPIDHWATLGETLERNGEDCDGLELLVYHLLRDMGFRDDEVARAIVLRPSDGQHHMVTLWFETTDDPWVIDPTGAMTSGMPRLSEVPGWVPLKLFTETAEFSPLPLAALR
jgi:predicted transglutaminase-like cysteine proteinase